MRRAILWLTAGLTTLFRPATPVVMPSTGMDTSTLLIAGIGVVALMIAIGQGHEWGWVSPATLGCLVIAVGTLALWVRLQLRGERVPDFRYASHERAVSGRAGR